ncbi:hypothetical protein EV181_004919, partial [Coemansia sp. RSA 532]
KPGEIHTSPKKSRIEAPIPCISPAKLMLVAPDGHNASIDIFALQVIGQADDKYIMCICDNWLVAIDQHAADERIRLERFFNELSTTLQSLSQISEDHVLSRVDGVSVLVPPAAVVLNNHEYHIIKKSTSRLRQLGIELAGENGVQQD